MKHLDTVVKKGPQGFAQVQRINQHTITIQFLDEWGKPHGRLFPFSTDTLLYEPQDGMYAVGLSAEEDKIYSIRPINATVIAKFSKFVAKEGQPPTPKRVQGMRTNPKTGESYPVDELTFTAILTITSEPHKGMELVAPFIYSRKGSGFVDDGTGNLAHRGGGYKGALLESFLEVAGVWGKEYPFSSNVLPMLELELRAANKEFMVIVKNGWPSSFGEVPTLFGSAVKAPATPYTMSDEEAAEFIKTPPKPDADEWGPIPTKTELVYQGEALEMKPVLETGNGATEIPVKVVKMARRNGVKPKSASSSKTTSTKKTTTRKK